MTRTCHVPAEFAVAATGPADDDDRVCGICRRPYHAHTGALCGLCRRSVEHHDETTFASCRAGRVRMAQARHLAGVDLDRFDRLVLGAPLSDSATGPTPHPATVAHLAAMTATGADGWLIISFPMPEARTARRGTPWASWSFPSTDIDAAARAAAELDQQGRNVYVRTNLLARPLEPTAGRWSWQRGLSDHTGAAVALAVDLDVAGLGHKGTAELPLPPTLDAAMSIMADLPPPSLDVATGGGRHLWWMLDEPEMDNPVTLIETWADRIVEAGRLLGWHVDKPDAARVLRVAGTHRRKPGVSVNEVALVAETNARYGASDLLEALPEPALPEPAPPPRTPRREPRPGEVSPADAVSLLSWAEILEPYGWTFAGTGKMSGTVVELWTRPGGATSDYSIKAVPDGPCVAWSDACGLPVGKGQLLSKFRTFTYLSGLTKSDAVRLVGARAREAARHA